MWRTRKLWRGVAMLAGAGVLLQTSSCAIDTEALTTQIVTLIIQQVLSSMLGTTVTI